ncbi:MAG TPA: hypothetical protein VEY32_09565 [Flavisolibacter sp.]|nr:hypothetical protein [Flavisolibacter sp.]
MKKTILAMVLMGSGAAVMAQDSLSVNTDNMNNGNTSANQVQKSTGNYPAYGSVAAPSAVQHSFNQQYPGTTDAQWQRSYNGYWRATYRQNGMPVNVYYADNGQSFSVALPVLQGAVPPEVVAKAIDLYGNSLYDITMVKVRTNDNAWSNNNGNMNANTNNNGMNGTTSMNGTTGMTGNSGTTGTASTNTQNRYIIRVIENGMLRAERMNEDGTPDQTYGTNNANAGMKSGTNSINNGTATMNNNTSVNTNANTDMNATTNGTSGSLNHSGSYSAYYGTTDGSNGSYYGTDSSQNQQSGSNMNQSGNWNNTNNSSNQMDSSNSNSGNSNNSNIDHPATGNLNSTNTNGTKTGTKKTTTKKKS